jgi:hypothetical protein
MSGQKLAVARKIDCADKVEIGEFYYTFDKGSAGLTAYPSRLFRDLAQGVTASIASANS